MSRHFPIVFGALHLGIVGAATYLLCSVNLLNEASIFFAH